MAGTGGRSWQSICLPPVEHYLFVDFTSLPQRLGASVTSRALKELDERQRKNTAQTSRRKHTSKSTENISRDTQHVHADVAALPYVTPLCLCITVVFNAQPTVYPGALSHVHSASLQRAEPILGPQNTATKCAQGEEDGDSVSMDDDTLSDLTDLSDLDHDDLDGLEGLVLTPVKAMFIHPYRA